MLDAISDFWKPNKKQDADAELDVAQLKIGSSIGFGFIPQGALSGKRATVQSINTYEFSGDRLTSYVLEVDGDTSISLIVADGQGEKYIALSRRIPFAERMRMLDNSELLACMDNADQKRLQTKQAEGEWRNWLADGYKKAIHGLKGSIMMGDFRGLTTPPDAKDAKEFNYTLLVSNNNEYAIEIEQYDDNRMEVYATVYRRLADIGEVKVPATDAANAGPSVQTPAAIATPPAAPKAANPVATTAKELAALKPANDMNGKVETTITKSASPKIETEQKAIEQQAAASVSKTPQLVSEQSKEEVKISPVIDSGKANSKPLLLDSLKDLKSLIVPKNEPSFDKNETPKKVPDFEPVKAVVPTIQTLTQPTPVAFPKVEPKIPERITKPVAVEIKTPDVVAVTQQEIKKVEPESVAVAANIPPEKTAEAPVQASAPAMPVEPVNSPIKEQPIKENIISSTKESEVMATYNATFNGKSESSLPQSEVRSARAVQGQHSDVENDMVECELRAANRVIEEAIRNEMRMSDVVRRIIALPVAQQEQVEIPVMLTDSDYHLLAIRYGIPAADRSAIKAKIVEEINDFSGSARA